MEGARAGGFAPVQLHHPAGHDLGRVHDAGYAVVAALIGNVGGAGFASKLRAVCVAAHCIDPCRTELASSYLPYKADRAVEA